MDKLDFGSIVFTRKESRIMKTNKLCLLMCGLLASLLVSCGPGQMLGPTLTPTQTPSPTPTMIPTLTPFPTIIFQDNFSDASSGWSSGKGNFGWASYDGGSYLVNGTMQGALFWGLLENRTFRDVVIDVDVTWVDTPTETSAFGVGCRSEYDFVISADDTALIFYDTTGNFEAIAEQDISRVGVLLNRTGVNRVRVICNKDRLALYLNDGFVVHVTDKRAFTGQIFLGASDAKVRFDNLQIFSP